MSWQELIFILCTPFIVVLAWCYAALCLNVLDKIFSSKKEDFAVRFWNHYIEAKKEVKNES